MKKRQYELVWTDVDTGKTNQVTTEDVVYILSVYRFLDTLGYDVHLTNKPNQAQPEKNK